MDPLTDEVVARFAEAPPRLREVIGSLVRHLHGFAREVALTQEEWAAGIEFLTRVGHLTDERRGEFILLSDVLGLSMATVGINAPDDPAATESTVLGPFFTADAPEVPLGGDLAGGAPGEPCWVSGSVYSTDGTPLAGVRVDVWEADETGSYDVQYPGDVVAGRGWVTTDDDGEFRFWAVTPSPYPIPHDGPVGELLSASGRSPMRPAHLHFRVEAPGHHTLVTHLFVAGDPYLDSDAVFGVRDGLVVDVEHDADRGTATLRADLVLARV